MGTQLFEKGLTPGECGMRWNEERPEDVLAVHQAYVSAGCRLITTNSFGGTRTMLDLHGAGDQVANWNRRAAALAREALGREGWVLGDVGPFGGFLEPIGETTGQELVEIFSEQIVALVEGGADAIVLETMSAPDEAAAGIRAARATCDLPVGVTFAFKHVNGRFCTMLGSGAGEVVEEVVKAGADFVGANCGIDLSLEEYVFLADELRRAADGRPLIIQPNAGTPKNTPQGLEYDASPLEMADTVLKLRGAGASILGGCCGTTPEHLAAMAAALR